MWDVKNKNSIVKIGPIKFYLNYVGCKADRVGGSRKAYDPVLSELCGM